MNLKTLIIICCVLLTLLTFTGCSDFGSCVNECKEVQYGCSNCLILETDTNISKFCYEECKEVFSAGGIITSNSANQKEERK